MRLEITILLLVIGSLNHLNGQEACNSLGVWLWFIENTSFENHDDLAAKVADIGAKRIYIKVGDGGIDSIVWPELVNDTIVDTYRKYGLEVWAWSYNYPDNESKQAEVLTRAAKSGYEGYVVDVEVEFDGLTDKLSSLIESFYEARNRVVEDGIIEDMPLYVTTWGNPLDHDFSIASMDDYVDAYMPQTYVENWGPSFIENLEFWINVGNDEFIDLGATKPIHHIVSTEKGILAPSEIDDFILSSGAETSIWRIPGGDVSESIWDTWQEVDFDINFCSSQIVAQEESSILINNYSSSYIRLIPQDHVLTIFDIFGNRIDKIEKLQSIIQIEDYPAGIYFIIDPLSSVSDYEQFVVTK